MFTASEIQELAEAVYLAVGLAVISAAALASGLGLFVGWLIWG